MAKEIIAATRKIHRTCSASACAAHANRPEIACRIGQAGESYRVRDRDGGNIQQAVTEVTGEETGEALRESRPDQTEPRQKMADAQEALCREVAIGKLVRNEDTDNSRDTPTATDDSLFRRTKAKHRHVRK
jgi:hypothetical protein